MPASELRPPGPRMSRREADVGWDGVAVQDDLVRVAQVGGVSVARCSAQFEKPHWMPMSRVKLREVTTMRASISTWGVAVSSSPIKVLGLLDEVGRSRMMIVLVRSSMLIWPREERAPALGQHAGQGVGLGVGDPPGVVHQVAGQGLGLGQLAALLLLTLELLSLAMRMTLPSRTQPRLLVLRISSRARPQGTSLSFRVTLPLTPGLTTTFRPEMSAKSRKMSCRSPSLKSRLMGVPRSPV